MSISQETVKVDPSIIPWSIRGSYLSMASRSGQDGRLTPGHDIYLISQNHPAGLPLFALRPNVDGPLPEVSGFHKTRSPVAFHATPSTMTWSWKGNIIAEATFENTRTIRIRGTVPMSFDTEGSLAVDQWRCWIFAVPPKNGDERPAVEFVSTPQVALRFTALAGRFSLIHDAPYDFNFKDNNRRITISPEEGSSKWELSITERDTHSEADAEVSISKSSDFDACVQDMASAFETYTKGMCPWDDSITSADRLACYVMWTSTVRAAGFLKSEVVLMSKLWMNKLWSWDNCLNGLALVQYDIDLAIDQILAPFQHMTQEGRLPDSMTRNELLFDYTKPPVYGWTMFKLLSLLDPQSSQSCPCFTSLTPRRLDEIYRQISRFTGFWFQHRSCSSSAIPYYTHGNDSGWDNSTSYDNQTVCVSPDLGAFLIVECDFLAKLALHLGKDATEWVHRREQLVKGIVDELWDEQRGSFLFKDAYSGRTWASSSLLQFLTLVAAHHLPPNILQRMADNLQPYLSEWGLATERLDSDLYESDGYWRGPIWAPPTIMLESGLRSAGMVELADTVLERFVRLCERNGFAENYDAKNGQGNRDLSYTWSASAYLTLRYEQTRRLGSGKSH